MRKRVIVGAAVGIGGLILTPGGEKVLGVAILGVIALLAWASWLGKTRSASEPSRPTAPMRVLPNGSKIYGEAGAHIASSNFGEIQKNAGSDGEKKVGAALEQFAAAHRCVVAHGLQFKPGRNGADVDHAVLLGDRLFLIDAKLWAYGSYCWAPDATVWRDGAAFSGSRVKMADAVTLWRAYLASMPVQVQSRICAAAPNAARYSFDNSGAPVTVKLTSVPELIAELTAVAVAQEHRNVPAGAALKLTSKVAACLQ